MKHLLVPDDLQQAAGVVFLPPEHGEDPDYMTMELQRIVWTGGLPARAGATHPVGTACYMPMLIEFDPPLVIRGHYGRRYKSAVVETTLPNGELCMAAASLMWGALHNLRRDIAHWLYRDYTLWKDEPPLPPGVTVRDAILLEVATESHPHGPADGANHATTDLVDPGRPDTVPAEAAA